MTTCRYKHVQVPGICVHMRWYLDSLTLLALSPLNLSHEPWRFLTELLLPAKRLDTTCVVRWKYVSALRVNYVIVIDYISCKEMLVEWKVQKSPVNETVFMQCVLRIFETTTLMLCARRELLKFRSLRLLGSAISARSRPFILVERNFSTEVLLDPVMVRSIWDMC